MSGPREWDEIKEFAVFISDLCADGVNVRAWDVSGVGALRSKYPGAFPSHLRSGPLVAYLHSETKKWMIDHA